MRHRNAGRDSPTAYFAGSSIHSIHFVGSAAKAALLGANTEKLFGVSPARPSLPVRYSIIPPDLASISAKLLSPGVWRITCGAKFGGGGGEGGARGRKTAKSAIRQKTPAGALPDISRAQGIGGGGIGLGISRAGGGIPA